MSSQHRDEDQLVVGDAGPLPQSSATPEHQEEEGSDPSRSASLVQRVEEAVTIAFFLAMFLVVLAAVVFRFVLSNPLVWTTGVATAAYIWVLTVGAGLSNRDDDHIQFDLIYERYTPLGKLVARILGNLLIIVPFAIAVPGTIEFLRFVAFDSIPGTFIHFNWVFGGVLVLLIATILHRGRLLALDLRLLITHQWGTP